MKCEICEREFNTLDGTINHVVRTHKVSKKDYYDTYYKKDDSEGKCKGCGQNTNFKSNSIGYYKYCSSNCANKNEIVRNNFKQKMIIKYGVDNPSKSKEVIQKIKNTKKERYGDEKYCNTEKIKETFRQKYGVDNVGQTDYVKNIQYEKREEIDKKIRTAFEKIGKWTPIEQLSDWNKYQKDVWCETNKWKKELFEKWNGLDFYTAEKLITDKKYYNDRKYRTIDHKISVKEGYNKKIDPKIIGNIDNLCICSKFNNTSKNNTSVDDFIIKLKRENKI